LEIYYNNINEWKEKTFFEKGLSLVNGERNEKVRACRFTDDRCRSLSAGLLIRHVCLLRGLCYDELRFQKSEKGKPLVDGFHYNVSHSGDYAVLIAGDVPAGIDVERLYDRFSGEKGASRLKAVVTRTFDEKEKSVFDQIQEKSGSLSKEALSFAAQVWTRKESYAKECGAGIGMDFATIHTLDADGFATFMLPGGYTVSAFSREQADFEFPVCVKAEEMIG
jgi:4'-phosphopantetheinyl transferase